MALPHIWIHINNGTIQQINSDFNRLVFEAYIDFWVMGWFWSHKMPLKVYIDVSKSQEFLSHDMDSKPKHDLKII